MSKYSRVLSVFTFGEDGRLEVLEICGKEYFKDFHLNFCLIYIHRNTYFIIKNLASQQTKHTHKTKPHNFAMQTPRGLATVTVQNPGLWLFPVRLLSAPGSNWCKSVFFSFGFCGMKTERTDITTPTELLRHKHAQAPPSL